MLRRPRRDSFQCLTIFEILFLSFVLLADLLNMMMSNLVSGCGVRDKDGLAALLVCHVPALVIVFFSAADKQDLSWFH